MQDQQIIELSVLRDYRYQKKINIYGVERWGGGGVVLVDSKYPLK